MPGSENNTNAIFNAHFFIEGNAFIQVANQAFGVTTDINKYRVTSKFTTTTPATAFAICKGIVFIQPQTGNEANLVNLVLRPFVQPIKGLKIKYFVYRGLIRGDFFTSDPTPVVVPSDDLAPAIISDLHIKITRDFTDFNSPTPPLFLAKYIGYDLTFSDDSLLCNYFFKETAFNAAGVEDARAFELPMIEQGNSLGRFAQGDCGIDVVLDFGDFSTESDHSDFSFDLNYARASEAIIDITGVSDEYAKMLKQEQLLNFIDITAFYGLCINEGGKISTVDSSGTKADKKGDEIYNEVVSLFFNKNTWYVYIYADRGRSYNFYKNYQISGTNTNALKLGIKTAHLSEQSYGSSGWPVIIDTLPRATTLNNTIIRNDIYLQLVTDANIDSMLYCSLGQLDNSVRHNFCDAASLKNADDAGNLIANLSKQIILSCPAISDSNEYKNISGISILHYKGAACKYVKEDASEGYLNPSDDIFDMVNATPLLKKSGTEAVFYKITCGRLKLINHPGDNKNQGISAAQTLKIKDAIDTGAGTGAYLSRVTYVAEPVDILYSPMALTGKMNADTKTSSAANTAIGGDNEYTLPEPYFYETKLFTENGQTINGLLLKTRDNSTPNKIILGITLNENDTLSSLIIYQSLINARIHFIDLFENGNDLISSENIAYKKYKIGIVGETTAGDLKLFLNAPEILVYSLDDFFYFSYLYTDKMTETDEAENLFINLDVSI